MNGFEGRNNRRDMTNLMSPFDVRLIADYGKAS
jgi:hypothetical protein